MCGIAGIVALNGFDPSLLMSMTHLIKYRGPDGFGFVYFDIHTNSPGECFHDQNRIPAADKPSLGFGTRRLAILDVSKSGNQPMQIEDGRYWITYNGEIYNYLEIRAELQGLGHSFRTQTDTEVVLRAYSQWGPNCVGRLNGMWSFAIWDRGERKLFCSRDRFGIKPFYYAAGPSFLVFGSEIKQLLYYPDVSRTMNDGIAMQYLEQGILDHSDQTFFAGVQQLKAGHCLTVDLSGAVLSIHNEKYWELMIGEESRASDQQAIDEFSSQLQRSVRWHMRSDVPVGSCLSGGLDSSSIVVLASEAADSKNFHAFSSCFEDESIDERRFIKEVISSTGAVSHLVFPSAEGFWDDLKCLMWHQDEPVGGTSVYAQWCVMRAARQAGVPVLLDGQGGDEILCGYRKFYIFYLWQLLRQGNPGVLREGIAWYRNVDTGFWNWTAAKRYAPSFGGNRRSLLARVCNPELAQECRHLPRAAIGPGQDLRRRQKDDLARYSLPALLHYEDRNSMAHSVEARVPLLDYQLAEFTVNCRPNLKLREGWTKWMLRQALKGRLPEPVRLRRSKLGFATPQKDWLRQDLRGTILALIHEPKLTMGRILSMTKIRGELEDFLNAKSGCLADAEAFRILNLELWARMFDVV